MCTNFGAFGLWGPGRLRNRHVNQCNVLDRLRVVFCLSRLCQDVDLFDVRICP